MNLKPFDLPLALAGAKVITRDGREVTQLKKFYTNGGVRIFGVCDGHLSCFNDSGTSNLYSNMDLFLAPEEVTKYINVYKTTYNESGYTVATTVYDTQ